MTQIIPQSRQMAFEDMSPLEDALSHFENGTSTERGAVFTKREIVDFILDLVGYTANYPLFEKKILEPSFGDGDFLIPIIERLLNSFEKSGNKESIVDSLKNSIRAVELHSGTYFLTKDKIIQLLEDHGIDRNSSKCLVESWLIKGDFLLTPIDESFDYVVGNPPYIRQELIHDTLMDEYRARYSTIYDRADIYIPFIERSLTLLKSRGELGFICADRWMKNRYGGPLRKFVSDGYNLKIFIDMVDTDAFHENVSTYPAITIIEKTRDNNTRIVFRPKTDRKSLAALRSVLISDKKPSIKSGVTEKSGIAKSSDPWLLEFSDQLALLRRLENDFPLIEEAGCKIGIGVATGADSAFIGTYDELNVEADRKIPLAMTKDINSGKVEWRGYGVINPFAPEGGLVDLDQYPLLRKYLLDRKDVIFKRHVAKKSPDKWYRTIDRIYPEIALREKLLIPDIKGEANIVYEEGKLYPHHNLYYITSIEWDIHALQAVLMSGIAKLFVSLYSTKMRGGYLRYQAQYLRRIRLPIWEDLNATTRNALIKAGREGNVELANQTVFEIYSLTKGEKLALGDNRE